MASVPKTARAAVLVALRQPLEIRDVQVPDTLEHGSILVKTAMASVCGSDVHDWIGDGGDPRRFKFPRILGHEMVGRIVQFGDGDRRDSVGTPLEEGDRVIWTHSYCGRCYNCTVEQEITICLNQRTYSRSWLPTEYPYLTGGWAEYCYVLPGSGRVKVPDEVPDELASAAACAFRTVIQGFDRLGDLDDRHSIVIQGSGPLGLFSTAIAAKSGPHEIIVVGGPARRLDIALGWGATHTINIEDMPDPAHRKEIILGWTDGMGPDCVVEVSGAPTAFSEGFDMVRRGGRYVLIGQSSTPATIIPTQIVRKHVSIIGNASGSVRHYYRALQFIKHNWTRFSWQDMISNHYPLERINDALEGMRTWKEVKPAITFAG
jgi:D-arabinose 1-dehydrogenase-like Zn-dependent alcohol dehydrogenase